MAGTIGPNIAKIQIIIHYKHTLYINAIKILAIETSCDETSIAIIDAAGSHKKPAIHVLAHNTSSQIKIHQTFGGVVPNLAKREHQKNLTPILLKSLKEGGFLNSKLQNPHLRQGFGGQANYKKIPKSKLEKIENILKREQELFARIREHVLSLKKPAIDAIAVTVGPGLEPALWVGINFARALATLWDLPIIPINHMEGHIYSAMLQQSGVKPKLQKSNFKQIKNFEFKKPKFPALALLVSGGHTELVLMKGIGKYTIIGETLDDAVGEAFDKTARLLGLPYPGGPQIARLAQSTQTSADSTQNNAEVKSEIKNTQLIIKLPRPMLHSKDFNFSFSGLKTAVLYMVRDLKKQHTLKDIRPAIANEFQNAAIEVLVSKTISAAKKYKAHAILLGGGVSANKKLRKDLKDASQKNNIPLFVSPLSLTGDNALMIAVAGFFNQKKAKKKFSSLKADAHMRLS